MFTLLEIFSLSLKELKLSQYQDLDIFTGINIDTTPQDVKSFGENAPALAFNGIERDGGITNVFEDENAIVSDYEFFDSNGDLWQGVAGSSGVVGNMTVKKNGVINSLINSRIGLESDYPIPSDCIDATLDTTTGNVIAIYPIRDGSANKTEIREYQNGILLSSRNSTVQAAGIVRSDTVLIGDVLKFLVLDSVAAYLVNEDGTGTETRLPGAPNGTIINRLYPATYYVYLFKNGGATSGYFISSSWDPVNFLGNRIYFITGTWAGGTVVLGPWNNVNTYYVKVNSITNKETFPYFLITFDADITGTTATLGAKLGFVLNTGASFTNTNLTYTTGVGPVSVGKMSGIAYSDLNFTSGGVIRRVYLNVDNFSSGVIGFTGTSPAVDNIHYNWDPGYSRIWINTATNLISQPLSIRIPIISINNNPSTKTIVFASAVYSPVEGQGASLMGVPITETGGIKPEFLTPEFFIEDHALTTRPRGHFLYFNGSNYIKKTIGPNIENMFQQQGNALYLGTLDPASVINIKTSELNLGPNDYAGCMNIAASNVNGILTYSIKSDFSNSLDVSVRDLHSSGAYYTEFNRIAILTSCKNTVLRDSSGGTAVTYIGTLQSLAVLYATPTTTDLIVPDSRIPVSLGSVITSGAANSIGQTAFLTPNYLGYELGNYILGDLTPFQLFSQNYVFDGANIYIAPMTSQNVLQTTELSPVNIAATAQGLRFIATSPTVIYFYSDYDKSLFAFDGGRTLQKIKRMNELETVIDGVYNVRDNTLILQTANTFIWVRDGVFSVQDKKAIQTNTVLYTTDEGIKIANGSYTWAYPYQDPGSSVTVPFIYQSAYFGQHNNVKSNISAFIVVVYSSSRAQTTWSIKVRGFDNTADWEETKTYTVNPEDYNTGGYARIRVQPINQKALGLSLEMSTASTSARPLINQITIEVNEDVAATIAASRTV